MVEERVTDGRRIAQLLSSELHGREDGGLDRVAVVDARDDVEPTVDGSRAYGLVTGSDAEQTGSDAEQERLGAVYVHPERAHVELRGGRETPTETALEAAVETAREAGLRVRPKAVEPPRTLIFVESGAEVKRAAEVVSVAAESSVEDGR